MTEQQVLEQLNFNLITHLTKTIKKESIVFLNVHEDALPDAFICSNKYCISIPQEPLSNKADHEELQADKEIKFHFLFEKVSESSYDGYLISDKLYEKLEFNAKQYYKSFNIHSLRYSDGKILFDHGEISQEAIQEMALATHDVAKEMNFFLNENWADLEPTIYEGTNNINKIRRTPKVKNFNFHSLF